MLRAFLIMVALFAGLFTSMHFANPLPSRHTEADLAWCDRIYHRNVSCPKYRAVKVPPHVIARERAQEEAWRKRVEALRKCHPYCFVQPTPSRTKKLLEV